MKYLLILLLFAGGWFFYDINKLDLVCWENCRGPAKQKFYENASNGCKSCDLSQKLNYWLMEKQDRYVLPDGWPKEGSTKFQRATNGAIIKIKEPCFYYSYFEDQFMYFIIDGTLEAMEASGIDVYSDKTRKYYGVTNEQVDKWCEDVYFKKIKVGDKYSQWYHRPEAAQ